ncbi:class I adenylate-forming enzyme family protein [Actinobaculum suis]|uniref:class I adenylate-forming enzyme family protein n=1 Tax=Actinobaculum suis TaxID=1657 RepID=UPI000ABFF270|nr:AMP-binding protein [Actinobaculum suis]
MDMEYSPIYNFAHSLDRAVFVRPEASSITYGEQTWTVREAADTSRRLAQLLVQAGITRGDRVMMVARNSPYHFFLAVACARIGAVFVPVSFRLTHVELQRLVDFCAPRVIVVEPEVGAAGPFSSPGTLLSFVIDDDVQAPPFTPALKNGYIALTASFAGFSADFLSDGKRGLSALNTNGYPEGVAVMMFRPALPEAPRAIELTYENLWWADRNAQESFGIGVDSVLLLASTCCSIGGLNGGTIFHFARGGHTIITRNFEPGGLLDAIEMHGVNSLFAVPTVYMLMLEHKSFLRRNLSSLHTPLIGGTPVQPALLGRLDAAGIHAINVWASAETAGPGAFLPSRYSAEKPGSVGRAVPYLEARITGLDGHEVAPGECGHLEFRGPAVSDGYWHGEAYTEKSFHDGWFRSGDLAVIDRDGFISLHGRVTSTIKSGGETIYPEEVEDVLRQYPGVAEAVVCGVPDALWGERVAAAVKMNTGEYPATGQIPAYTGQIPVQTGERPVYPGGGDRPAYPQTGRIPAQTGERPVPTGTYPAPIATGSISVATGPVRIPRLRAEYHEDAGQNIYAEPQECGENSTPASLATASHPVEGVKIPTLEDMQAFAGRILGRHKLPRILAVVDSLPRDSKGRPSRQAAREYLLKLRSGHPSE